MVTHVEHPVDGTVPVLASPLRLSTTPVTVRRPPPLLGEHTDEVLGAAASDRTGR
jgi:formyl-CoA transferase